VLRIEEIIERTPMIQEEKPIVDFCRVIDRLRVTLKTSGNIAAKGRVVTNPDKTIEPSIHEIPLPPVKTVH
jgi:hypothetical protein